VQYLLKPLVVSWGYESEMPSGSTFIDHHEWWGTRDIAAFLSVPAAIAFQAEHDWDKVREACHELAVEAQERICSLTSLEPLCAVSGRWFGQMVSIPLPRDTDILSLKERLYREYRIEVPLLEWIGVKLMRVSIQGYNTEEDVDALVEALQTELKGIH
jgi:isopenicillin-N epimerase